MHLDDISIAFRRFLIITRWNMSTINPRAFDIH